MLPTEPALHGHDGDSSMDRGRGYRCRAPAFVGRVPELDALDAALAAARGGEPQVVVIQGEAGIGKSSLIFEFLGHQQGLPAIVASGETAEMVLPYGVVRQMAVGAAEAYPGILAGLELLSDGPGSSADPLAVGVELRALLSSLGRRAAAVVIEDLQWADLPSAKALLFACRRLGADRVLVVLTCRPGATSQLGEGWARFVSGDRRASALTLRGLDTDELDLLCRRLGRMELSERTVRRLADHTGGNPLLARALLDDLTDDELKASGGSFRAPRSLAGLILPRLASLPRPARDLVVAASVLGDHATLADAATLARTAEPTGALDKAVRAGLLFEQDTPSGRAVKFPHLLIRQAVYGDLGVERRRRLHLRAAAILGGQASLAHRVAAADGRDAELAADLSAAATAAADAGNLVLSARYLQQAAAVAGHGPDRDENALSAFELLVRTADVAAASAAKPVIEQLPASARRDAALGQLALLAGRPADAEALLRAAWDAHDITHDSSAGGEAALGLGMLLKMSGAHAEAAVWLDRALSSGTGSEPWYDAARCIRSFAFGLGGDAGRALGLFGDLPARPAMVAVGRTDALAFRGIARLRAGDLHAAAGDLALAVNRISAGVHVRFPCRALVFLAETEFRLGRWDDARSHAELAVALACDADRAYDLALVHSAAVPVAACRGDWAAAEGHAQAAEQAARTFSGFAAVLAASARGILGLARDDPEEALRGAALALAVPQIDRYDPAAFWWRPAQVWALIRTGHVGQAEAILAVIEAWAARRGERAAVTLAAWLRGSLAMARGDLAEADEMLQATRQACRGQPLPFHRGLLDLQHSQCLRLLHRHGAAVDAGRVARDVFSVLGAVPSCGPPKRSSRGPARSASKATTSDCQGSPDRKCGWRSWWRPGFPTARSPPSCEGQTSEFVSPLYFIELSNPASYSDAADAWNKSGRTTRDLGGQKIAYAASDKPGDTTLDTSSLTIGTVLLNNGAADPPFFPDMTSAAVNVPAIQQVTGKPGAVTVGFYQDYLTGGFGTGGVFLQLDSVLPVGFSGDQSGGVATPNLQVSGLSRRFGTVSGPIDEIAGGTFNPKHFFTDPGAMLFGVVSLSDLISQGSFGDNTVPALLTKRLPDAIQTSLHWAPKVEPGDYGLVTLGFADPASALTIDALIVTHLDGSPPEASVSGALNGFTLKLAGVIELPFGSLTFHAATGKKLDVAASLSGELQFIGDLTFLNALRQFISADGFSDPPSVDVTADGVEVGYSLAIPSIGVGVFSLENIRLAAGLTLPFLPPKPLRFRFAFSERDNPFLISVSFLSGGGFFGIALGPDGVEMLEASLEVGANASIDLLVASGNVHIMAGVYLRLDNGSPPASQLTGYLRAGGSLDILGLISASVEFYLGFTYYFGPPCSIAGEATVTIEVHVLFFSGTVKPTLRRQFSDPQISVADLLSPADWDYYCDSFAG